MSMRMLAQTARVAQRSLHAATSVGSSSMRMPRAVSLPSIAAAALSRRGFCQSRPRLAFSYPTSRTLDEIVKLPLLIPHSRAEVAEIWAAHHAQQATLAADTLNAEEHQRFVERAKKAPLFVVPCFKLAADSSLPYSTLDTVSGFEMMLVNVQASSFLLTSLEEYKLRGAGDATPYAVITLYSDMAASKDLVLVRAEMMDVNVAVPQLQAMWILLKQLFTDADATAFERFPQAFNKKPNPVFDFDQYIEFCKKQAADIKLPKSTTNFNSDTPAAEFVEQPKSQ